MAKKGDFISLADFSTKELWAWLQLARDLKVEWQSGGNKPVLQGKVLGMIFQKPSLRTRVSFEMGMKHLGGDALYLSPQEIGLGGRESVADVARVLSRYVDGIMARVFAHQHVVDLAQHSRVPVINGLSDYSHPCQGLTDLFTVWEKLGRLSGVKLTYVGDGNNVAASLMFGGAKLGVHVTVATPPGYEPRPDVTERARAFAESGGSVTITNFQINAKLVSAAKPSVLVMHCLPAHRGQEITDEVADGPHSVLFDQAENRMHAQKAILADLLG